MSGDDSKTQHTAYDSLLRKYGAMKAGYYESSLLEPFVNEVTKCGLASRSIILNRGYYTRILSQKEAIKHFLEHTKPFPKVQVLYLGAGFDISGIEIAQAKAAQDVDVFEIDFAEIIGRKRDIINKLSSVGVLSNVLEAEERVGDLLTSSWKFGINNNSMTLISHDLRDASGLLKKMKESGFQSGLPAIIITECVFAYIEEAFVTDLIDTIGNCVHDSSIWFTYDMMHLHDRYGDMMAKNLSKAGFSVPGLTQFPTISSQKDRFCNRSTPSTWKIAGTITMLDYYNHQVSSQEKLRLESIEQLDEIEEWSMIMRHYCITLASKEQSETTQLCIDMTTVINT